MGNEGFGYDFQLAVKLLRDPQNYDLAKWLEIAGRHCPTQDDVGKKCMDVILPDLIPTDYPIF